VGCFGGELQNTSHDICRGSFSRFIFLSPSLTHLTLPPGRNDTDAMRKRGDTTRKKGRTDGEEEWERDTEEEEEEGTWQ
jgi:hypothetical protein